MNAKYRQQFHQVFDEQGFNYTPSDIEEYFEEYIDSLVSDLGTREKAVDFLMSLSFSLPGFAKITSVSKLNNRDIALLNRDYEFAPIYPEDWEKIEMTIEDDQSRTNATVYFGLPRDVYMLVYENGVLLGESYTKSRPIFGTIEKVMNWMSITEEGGNFYDYEPWIGKVCRF